MLFYMCQLWALHVFIKRQFFYIYPSTNRARRRLASLIKTNTLPLRQTATDMCASLPEDNRTIGLTSKRRVNVNGTNERMSLSQVSGISNSDRRLTMQPELIYVLKSAISRILLRSPASEPDRELVRELVCDLL